LHFRPCDHCCHVASERPPGSRLHSSSRSAHLRVEGDLERDPLCRFWHRRVGLHAPGLLPREGSLLFGDGGRRRGLPHSREHLVPSGLTMIGPDEIIHQHTRLRITATLAALSEGRQVEFTRLRAILCITDGNLGAHLTTLENAGYVAITKDFVGKRPPPRLALPRAGGKAFSRHVAFLREILDGEGPERENH